MNRTESSRESGNARSSFFFPPFSVLLHLFLVFSLISISVFLIFLNLLSYFFFLLSSTPYFVLLGSLSFMFFIFSYTSFCLPSLLVCIYPPHDSYSAFPHGPTSSLSPFPISSILHPSPSAYQPSHCFSFATVPSSVLASLSNSHPPVFTLLLILLLGRPLPIFVLVFLSWIRHSDYVPHSQNHESVRGSGTSCRPWLLRFPTGDTGTYKGASTHARAPVDTLYLVSCIFFSENPEVKVRALQCSVQIDYEYKFKI